ncbi:MAG: hypothetical protein EXR07_11990 [Acetobacteraceae bacterium]|nr:hypothetical protein [Acetobacteraceae bacterium]
MLEERGLPTTVLALVLPQVEKTRPPRAVMTPFMLGRPLGEPNDAPFQRRVLLQALRLLERTDGPVILEHFPDDNPSWTDRPGWAPAMSLPPPGLYQDRGEWEAAFRAELTAVLPAWGRFKARFGRTTTGLAGQPPEAWPAFAASFLDGALPTVPLHDTPALALRFLADDLKALYGEAAQADGPPPSARQIDRWFWRQTVAGQLLIALRRTAMESENNAIKTVGGRFFVPVPWLPV